jgi:hypothetical protein
LRNIPTAADAIDGRSPMMNSIRMAWNSTALTTDQSTAPDRISTPDTAAEQSRPLPEAAFDSAQSLSQDPLGLLDRVERLLDRYFESDAMLSTAQNAGFNRNGLDACHADGQWTDGVNEVGATDEKPREKTVRGTIIPLAAMALGASIAGGSRTADREHELRIPKRRGPS